MPANISIICGSVRDNSRTSQAARVLANELKKLQASPDIIDPQGIQVPYLGAPFPEPFASELRQRVAKADGVILCTPEYNGCFSSVMMAIIENLGYPVVFAGKPVAFLGVAAGRIGAIKALEHLRGVCSHSGAIVLPGDISIAEVNLHFDQQGNCTNTEVEMQIRSVAQTVLRFLQSRKTD